MSLSEMAATKKPAKGKAADAKGSKNGAKAAAGKADKTPEAPKRKLGLRGAAPWAARHAAKHAAEARARAAEPPLPGSARATIRTPVMAEDIKAKIGELHNSLQTIKGLRKNLAKGFYDIGIVLKDIQARQLYQAKGFGTFEAFLGAAPRPHRGPLPQGRRPRARHGSHLHGAHVDRSGGRHHAGRTAQREDPAAAALLVGASAQAPGPLIPPRGATPISRRSASISSTTTSSYERA